MEDFYEALLDRLKREDRFILTTHRGPDPDGMGAEVGLHHLLGWMGKEVQVLNHDPIPGHYRFLDEKDILSTRADQVERAKLLDSTVVVVDNSDLERIGSIKEWVKDDQSNLLIIDHHDGLEADLRVLFLQANVGSTSEIVYELIERAGAPIPRHIALALYAGIVVDTGFFRYSKTRPRTHEIAARLIAAGVETAPLSERLLCGYPVGRLFARRKLYESLQVNQDETVAWFTVHKHDLNEINVTFDDLDGMVNELIEPDEVQVGILFSTREAGKTKVSVRSKGAIDLLPAVRKYGGGGHKNACGAMIPLDLPRAIREFLPLIEACVASATTA